MNLSLVSFPSSIDANNVVEKCCEIVQLDQSLGKYCESVLNTKVYLGHWNGIMECVHITKFIPLFISYDFFY